MSQHNPFLLPREQYVRRMDIVEYYLEDQAYLVGSILKKPASQVKYWLRAQLNQGGRFEFKDPITHYLRTLPNGDRVEETGTLLKYIKESLAKKQIIAPTLSTFCNVETFRSILSQYIELQIKARKVAKDAAKAAKVNGDLFLFELKNSEQKNRKLKANATSGQLVAKGTVIRNKTGHSVLTSNCRATAGFGNTNNERFLAGRRHYWRYGLVLDHIASCRRLTDMDLIEQAITQYGLAIPSVDDIMQMIDYCTRDYWRDGYRMDMIRIVVEQMSDRARAAFYYVGDFKHLALKNEKFAKALILALSKRCASKDVQDPVHVIRSLTDDQMVLLNTIYLQEMQGKGMKYDELEPELQQQMAATALNIGDQLIEYSLFIRAFWVTPNLPASMAYFPSANRRVTVTGDTDSTMFTVLWWVIWAVGEDNAFGALGEAVAGVMIYFVSSTIAHSLAMMSANLGYASEHLFLTSMKNEFKFHPLVMTMLGKHYFALRQIQEGMVLAEPEKEIKGVQLKNSTSAPIIIEQAAELMGELCKTVASGKKLSALKLYRQVADIEREVIRSLQASETTYLRTAKINEKASYKNEPEKSPYERHYFWNEVMGPKYGMMPDPPYGTVKFSSTLNTPTRLKAWLDTLEDASLRQRWLAYMEKTGKDTMKTLYMPAPILYESGIAKELMDIMDVRKIVADQCKTFYIILECLGYSVQGAKHNKRLLCDLY